MARYLFLLLLVLPRFGHADVTLPALLTDNLVLQQKTTVALWGWAAPGEAVAVAASWHKTPAKTTADAQGNWLVRVPTGPAGGPYTIAISGQNRLTISNVLLGEVWLCSGQSNMNFPVVQSTGWRTGLRDAAAVIAQAQYPAIRFFTVAQKVADAPERDVQGRWAVCSPETVGPFSAVAYFFGLEIHQKMGVPVGLIHSSWGGTPAESWTRREVLAAWNQEKAAHPASPTPKPAEPLAANSNKSPAKLYNGMIHGLLPYTLRGVVWYQGESNAERAYQYRTLFPALITNWRHDWQRPRLPFYFVQIAPNRGQNPEIRDAQLHTLRTVPHTGLVVTTDVGDSLDLHPRDKRTVGHRLALWALAKDYGQPNLAYSGPLYQRMALHNGAVHLRFEHAAGLRARDGGPLREFTVAGPDSVFRPARARIVGRTVVVSSPQVARPVAVRFGWRHSPMPNLVNAAGLPASPFRTDAWPVATQGNN